MTIKFERRITNGGKTQYLHIANGIERERLYDLCMAGEISDEEMRRRAKRLPYIFHKLPAGAVLQEPDKPIVCYGCKAQTMTKDNSFDLPKAAGWNIYQNRYWCNVCSEEWRKIMAEVAQQ